MRSVPKCTLSISCRCAGMKRSLLVLMRRHGLLERLERLQILLSVQIETLPLGNESWLDTERELVAIERALERIPAFDL